MTEALARVRGLFWDGAKNRLRAPFRMLVTLGLLLLAARLILTFLTAVDSGLSLPNPVFVALGTWLLAAAAVGIGWFVDRRYLRDMGADIDRQWALDAAAGLVVGFAMVAAVVGILRVAGMATFVGEYTVADPDVAIAGESAGRSLLYGLLLLGAAAVLEEVVVRSILLVNAAEGLRGYLPTPRTAVSVAVLLTALLFGVLHAANPGGTMLSLPNLTLAGVFLGVTYAVTGRLGFPIGFHVAWNVALGPIFGLQVSGLTVDAAAIPVSVDGPTLVTGGTFGPEGGLVMLIALAIGAAGFAWWARTQYDGVVLDERIAIPDLWVDDESED